MTIEAKPIRATSEIKVGKLNYPYPLNDALPDLYFNALCVGSRGAGKTTAITRLLRGFEDSGIYDPKTGLRCAQRIIIVSPTYHANSHIFANLKHLDDDDVHTEYEDVVLQMILADIKSCKKETDDYLRQVALFKKFEGIKDVSELSNWELMELDRMGYEPPSPDSVKYDRPVINFIIIDDMVGSNIYKQGRSYFKSQLIKNRHDGVCYLLCSQSLKAIPKDIRLNCSVWFLWRFNNAKINEEIHEELSNKLTLPQFEELYDYATKTDHDYLVVDFTKPKDKGMFNSSYKEVLVLK